MVMCVVGMRWEIGEKSVEKKRDRRFYINYRGRGRAVGDGAHARIRKLHVRSG